MNLSAFYFEYYKNPTKNILLGLLENIIKYDFENYFQEINLIFNYYKNSKSNFDFCYLKSNGSQNSQTKYKFGPNSKECIMFVEKYLRNANENKTLLVSNIEFGNCKYATNFYLSENLQNSNHSSSWQKNFEVKAQWEYDSHIRKLIKTIDDFYIKYGKINLTAMPNILNCLTTNKAFNSWINNNYHKINIVNTDWDLSIKKNKARIIDQMIDWKSGINFFTCEKEKKHFLPIFKIINNKCYNLLNLQKELFYVDDYIVLGSETKKCDCGKKYLDLSIITHYKNKIRNKTFFINFDNFYNNLECQYYNLQIYQNLKNEIFVYYCTNRSENFEKDKGKIMNFFKENNLKNIEFVNNKYFVTNRKRPSIWRSESINIKSFIKPNVSFKII